MRVLIVEDEPNLARVVKQALDEAGYSAHAVHSRAEGEAIIASGALDMMILDVMLPDGNGLDLLANLRRSSDLPVLILTARGGLDERIRGLDGGADDYLVKPFRLEELLARVRALFRRARGTSETLALGELRIDFAARRVTQAGRVVFLSTTEYALLELLAKSRGRAVSKDEILRHVWDDAERGPNVVEVYVNYLRHKLERNGAPRLIHTVRRRGYLFDEAEELAQP
jgi:two-component system, OmpR family, copper resistance phosphate regulon response regulator CusR